MTFCVVAIKATSSLISRAEFQTKTPVGWGSREPVRSQGLTYVVSNFRDGAGLAALAPGSCL